jgi:hypothetical protein
MGIRSFSNCLIFSIRLYLRRARKGDAGYLVMRRSRFGNFPHFLYMRRNGRLVSYCPINPKHKRLPPPVFRGFIKWGDR